MSKALTDRVEKALEIHSSGAVLPSTAGAGRFLVRSASKEGRYYSTGLKNDVAFCSCRDYEMHGKVCKHLLSSVGLPALIAITQFRWANDLEELHIAGTFHAAALQSLPQAFQSLAREEYKVAKQRLSAATLGRAA